MPTYDCGRCLLLVQLTLGHEAAIEWALLAEPLEPHLANAGVAAGMGPRIAVVAALHQLAAAAGLVQDSTHSSDSSGLSNGSRAVAVGAGSDSGFAAAAVAAGVGLWRKWIQVRLCVQLSTVLLSDPIG